MADNKNVRYLNPIAIDTKSERYCRFREKGFKYIDSKDPNIDWANSDFYLEVEALAQNMPRREPPPPPQYKWWIVKADRVAVRPTPGRHGAPP